MGEWVRERHTHICTHTIIVFKKKSDKDDSQHIF